MAGRYYKNGYSVLRHHLFIELRLLIVQIRIRRLTTHARACKSVAWQIWLKFASVITIFIVKRRTVFENLWDLRHQWHIEIYSITNHGRLILPNASRYNWSALWIVGIWVLMYGWVPKIVDVVVAIESNSIVINHTTFACTLNEQIRQFDVSKQNKT